MIIIEKYLIYFHVKIIITLDKKKGYKFLLKDKKQGVGGGCRAINSSNLENKKRGIRSSKIHYKLLQTPLALKTHVNRFIKQNSSPSLYSLSPFIQTNCQGKDTFQTPLPLHYSLKKYPNKGHENKPLPFCLLPSPSSSLQTVKLILI